MPDMEELNKHIKPKEMLILKKKMNVFEIKLSSKEYAH